MARDCASMFDTSRLSKTSDAVSIFVDSDVFLLIEFKQKFHHAMNIWKTCSKDTFFSPLIQKFLFATAGKGKGEKTRLNVMTQMRKVFRNFVETERQTLAQQTDEESLPFVKFVQNHASHWCSC